MRTVFAVLLCAVALIYQSACSSGQLNPEKMASRNNILRPSENSKVIHILDAKKPFKIDPVDAGWVHYQFTLTKPMELSFGEVLGKPALLLNTSNSASMLLRHTAIPLRRYSKLRWSWIVQKNISTTADERSSKGDDAPARIFIYLKNSKGEFGGFELVWGHQLGRGDEKIFHKFYHRYVRGPQDKLGNWYTDELNIAELVEQHLGDFKDGEIQLIGFFADSDDTKSSTSSALSNLFLSAD